MKQHMALPQVVFHSPTPNNPNDISEQTVYLGEFLFGVEFSFISEANGLGRWPTLVEPGCRPCFARL